MQKNKGYISIILAGLMVLVTISAGVYLNSDEYRGVLNVGDTVNTLPVRNFLALTDTPNTYSGQGGKVVQVNAGATALEFATAAGGGDALVANPLSQFASTTSLQLKGVMSDETGSGALVFATSPVFTTPNIGSATGSISGNAGTATALAANGANCSAGSSPLGVDASGAVESCFDVWTEAENTSAAYLTGNQTITLSGDVSGSGATGITTTIGADKILESMLKAVDAPTDEECLTKEDTTGDFEWQSCGGVPTAITVADTTDTTSFVGLWTDATGDLGPKTDAGLTYNATTGMLTATGLTGPLTGNVTGNVSGTAATVTGAAQTAITSLGTLTTLTVDDITINGNTISSAGASTLAITPTAGQAITFDGTVTLDAGVIAGATSITSTTFVGALTGNADTATALAANPADCAANQFANVIAASGALTCAAIADADVPNTITIDLATVATTGTVSDAGGDTTTFPMLAIDATGNLGSRTDAGLSYQATTNALTATTFIGALTGNSSTATALAANGANCSAGSSPLGVDASGAAESCTAYLTLTGGTMTGAITLGENASIALDPAGSADGKYTGTTVTGTGGTTIAFGDLVYLDPTDSRWELADANSASAADGDSRGILGIAVTTSTDGGAITVLLHGIVRADAVFPALTINAPVYVSETAGDVVVTQPTTADVVIRVLGFALTADEFFFNPSSDYITHI